MAKAQPGGAKPRRDTGEGGFRARFQGWMRVADRWEVVSLALAPLAVLFTMFQHDLGIPTALTGFAFVALVYYVGYFFTVLLIWDRRVDREKARISRGNRRQKLRDLLIRQEERKTVANARKDAQARNEAAMQRGRMKAAGRAADDAPDRPPQP